MRLARGFVPLQNLQAGWLLRRILVYLCVVLGGVLPEPPAL